MSKTLVSHFLVNRVSLPPPDSRVENEFSRQAPLGVKSLINRTPFRSISSPTSHGIILLKFLSPVLPVLPGIGSADCRPDANSAYGIALHRSLN